MKNRGSTPIWTNLVGVNMMNIHTKLEANPCNGLREVEMGLTKIVNIGHSDLIWTNQK